MKTTILTIDWEALGVCWKQCWSYCVLATAHEMGKWDMHFHWQQGQKERGSQTPASVGHRMSPRSQI